MIAVGSRTRNAIRMSFTLPPFRPLPEASFLGFDPPQGPKEGKKCVDTNAI